MDYSKKKQTQLIVTDGIDGGRRWRFLLVFAVCLAVFLTMADAQLCHADDPAQERTILAKGSDTYVPYSFLNEDGEVDGFNNELFRAVAEAAGLKAEIHLDPWPIVRQELEAGEIDVTTGMYYSKERDKLVDYSVPFVTVKHSIFVREDSQIKSLEDLGGKEVIVMRGAIAHDFLIQEGIAQEIVLTEDTPAALRLLATGQHDAALLIHLQGLYLLREFKIGNVKPVAEPFSPMKFCFAVREGDSELLFRLNEGFLVIKETGKYDEIYDKWFGILEKEAVSFSQVLRYIVLIALPLLVMLLAVASSGVV